MPPPPIQVYGIDSLVLTRLVSGLPEKDFRETLAALKGRVESDHQARFVVSNQVIGETYVALQLSYGISKDEARSELARVLTDNVISPEN